MHCRQKGAKEASDEPQEEKYQLESKSTAFLGEALPKQQHCESWNKRFSWFPSPTTPHRLMWELKIVLLELFGLFSERAALILKTSIMIAVVMKIMMVKMMYMYYLWNNSSYWSRASLFTWLLFSQTLAVHLIFVLILTISVTWWVVRPYVFVQWWSPQIWHQCVARMDKHTPTPALLRVWAA